ncbi:MAG: hypothetical protein WAL34_04290 [Acidobacteriaceae bacterium]
MAAKVKKVASLIGSNVESDRHDAADVLYQVADHESTTVRDLLEDAFGGSGPEREIEQIPGDAFRQFVSTLWSHPQTRAVLWAAIGIVLFWHAAHGGDFTGMSKWGHRWWVMGWWALRVSAVWLFVNWIGADYVRNGACAVVLKMLLLGPAVYYTLAAFYGNSDIKMWSSDDVNLQAAALCMCGVALIATTKMMPAIAERLTSSEQLIFRALRRWFA